MNRLILTLPIVLIGCDIPTALPRVESTFALTAADILVPVIGVPAAGPPIGVDFSGVDESLRGRARRATIVLTPLDAAGVSGTLDVTLRAPNGTVVTERLQVNGGTALTIELTENEVQSFLGNVVTVTTSGALGPPRSVPDIITLRPVIQIVLELGGES